MPVLTKFAERLALRASISLIELAPLARADTSYARGPLVMSSEAALLPEGTIDAGQVKHLMLDHVFGAGAKASLPAEREPVHP